MGVQFKCWALFSTGILFRLALGAPVTEPDKAEGSIGAMYYLSKYGYMDASVSNPQTGALVSWDSVTEAIKSFQEFAWLNVTGELDEETIAMMKLPRCGVKDNVGFGSKARRRKGYSLQGSKWRVKTLTYNISKYPQKVDESDVDDEIRKAFDVWEEVTGLSFSPFTDASKKIHIKILFESGEHGDGDPFDSVGGTLAHAFFPIHGGDVHFDRAEKWTIKSYRGTNLFQVAAHEIGHSLGLSHSDLQNALMAPFYRGWVTNSLLNDDDIKAIQDDKYWRFTDMAMDEKYPKQISKGFAGIPDNVDAAFVWSGNGKIYFTKGTEYWGFDPTKRPPVKESYPKQVTNWQGIPGVLDGVLQYSNGYTYFFKEGEYYPFNDRAFRVVDTADPPFSRATGYWWFGCPDSEDLKMGFTFN